MNLANVPVAWALYEQYGDIAALSGSYPQMSAALDNYMSRSQDGVWPEPPPGEHHGFGDWCPPIPAAEVAGGVGGPDIDGYEECFSEVSLVNTALAYRDARIVAAAARALGHGAEASHFDAEARGRSGERSRRASPTRRRRLRLRTAGDEHPAAGLRHGAEGAPGGRLGERWSNGCSNTTETTSTPASSAPATCSTRSSPPAGRTWL